MATGSFTIIAIHFDGSGNVDRLAAIFAQHCEGLTPALNGTIHYYA
jgi:hypothetical protein